jgi:hypothetical protein
LLLLLLLLLLFASYHIVLLLSFQSFSPTRSAVSGQNPFLDRLLGSEGNNNSDNPTNDNATPPFSSNNTNDSRHFGSRGNEPIEGTVENAIDPRRFVLAETVWKMLFVFLPFLHSFILSFLLSFFFFFLVLHSSFIFSVSILMPRSYRVAPHASP